MKVCEVYRSIQGEGKTIGLPTYFIRLAGCNLTCSWCDRSYASDKNGEECTVDEIIDLVKDENSICITGGEPLIQDDVPVLIRKLADIGKSVVVETNGSVDISLIPVSENIIISMDIKCPSSKMHESMNFDNISKLGPKDQLKFVISDNTDLDYAVSVLDKYKPNTEVIFSAVGGMDIEPLAEEVLCRRMNVRVLPQLHKIIWGNRSL